MGLLKFLVWYVPAIIAPKRQAVELCVEEQLNTSPSLADSTLDLTVTYDYNMPAYVASGPVKSNNEIVQLFTIDESPHRQPKRLSLTVPDSFHSPAKKKLHRAKAKGSSVSPEDLRRFEELAHMLVQCKGPLDFDTEDQPSEHDEHKHTNQSGSAAEAERLDIIENRLGSLAGGGSPSKDDLDELFTSEELGVLDSVVQSANRFSPAHIQPHVLSTHSPCPPRPPLSSSSLSSVASSCVASNHHCPSSSHIFVAPPSVYLTAPSRYVGPQHVSEDSDDDHDFWTDAADLLDGPLVSECTVKPSGMPHDRNSPECSTVSSQPHPCSQEDIAQKRNRALQKLAARKCNQKVT